MFKYNRPNRRLECCRWTYLRSQMSYPHAWCVLLCFLSELHTWGKEVRDWRWLCFYFYSSPSSCGLSAYKPLCVHEGFLQLIPPPSVARTPPLHGPRTMFITWSESWQQWARAASSGKHVHCHAWLASSHQRQLTRKSPQSFWTGSSSLALLWLDVLRCAPVVRMWHIPFLLLISRFFCAILVLPDPPAQTFR